MSGLARVVWAVVVVLAVTVFSNGGGASADSGVAYNARKSWLPSNAEKATRGVGCQTRTIDLKSGQYRYRNFDRNLRHTATGAHERTFVKDRSLYLSGGRYVWTDCLYLSVPGETTPCAPNCTNAWVHDSALTRADGKGAARNDVEFRVRGGYDRITEWGSVLYRCSASPVC
jgi:hypothetical protein